MSEQNFDAFIRHATQAVSRRESLMMLGGAALAAAAAKPSHAEAAESGKKNRKKAKRQARKKCGRQVGQCRTIVIQRCTDSQNPQICEESALPCCEFFSKCNAGAGLQCLFAL